MVFFSFEPISQSYLGFISVSLYNEVTTTHIPINKNKCQHWEML
jgi:hypothetical protein